MKTMRVVLSWTLAAGLTWAGSALGDSNARPADDGSLQAALDSRPLFVELDAAAPGSTLAFDVAVDGRPWLRETLTLGPTRSPRPAYELLAHEPARLEELYRLAAEPGVDVRLEVSLDGRLLGASSFAELVTRNRVLKTTPFRAEAPVGRALEGLGAADGPPVGGPSDSQPAPACTPTVTTYYTRELVSQYGGGWRCYYSRFGVPSPTNGEYFETMHRQYKISQYRKTVYCDGTEAVELVSVSYVLDTCQRPRYLPCSSPFGFAVPICYL